MSFHYSYHFHTTGTKKAAKEKHIYWHAILILRQLSYFGPWYYIISLRCQYIMLIMYYTACIWLLKLYLYLMLDELTQISYAWITISSLSYRTATHFDIKGKPPCHCHRFALIRLLLYIFSRQRLEAAIAYLWRASPYFATLSKATTPLLAKSARYRIIGHKETAI